MKQVELIPHDTIDRFLLASGSTSAIDARRSRTYVGRIGNPSYLIRGVVVIAAALSPCWSGTFVCAQSPDATGATGTGDSPPTVPTGFFDIVFSGGWVGFSIILLLLGLSLTAAYLVFEQVMTIRRQELMPDGLSEKVRGLLTAGRYSDAETACRARPSFLSFVLLNGIAEIEAGWSGIEKAMEDAMAEQAARLLRKIEYLSVIGNIAPMVGLLGTVTGMIFAFQRVAATQGAAGAAELAEGIYQALVTTVGGLIVAIPALGAFAVLRNRVDQLVAEAAYMAQHVVTPLKRSRTISNEPPPPPAATGA